jgi:hypothetical protein
MIEYRFRVPSATVFTLYSYSKALEYRFRVPTADSLRISIANYIWCCQIKGTECYDRTAASPARQFSTMIPLAPIHAPFLLRLASRRAPHLLLPTHGAVSCSASPRAPRMLPMHWMHIYASRLLTRLWIQLCAPHLLRECRDRCVRGDHLRLRPLATSAHETLATQKYLLQHTSEIDETFTTYACNIWYGHYNICNIQIKTLATHIWNSWNIWNIHL